tara:strand:- start:471 stop:1052 length:582 start_codon:yes stop_codon:yes gene_type:complete
MKIKSLSPYQKRKIKKNLLEMYEKRTDQHTQEGMQWYKTANQICVDMGKQLDYDPAVVAQVISALSPRNKWEKNIIDTRTVLEAVNDGKSPEDVKVSTFHSNKNKAFEIARGERGIDQASPKTYSFVKNIAELDDSKVTIDVWHLRACFGKTIESGLTPLRYKQLEQLTLKCAEMVGVRGYEFQAIVWGIVRN